MQDRLLLCGDTFHYPLLQQDCVSFIPDWLPSPWSGYFGNFYFRKKWFEFDFAWQTGLNNVFIKLHTPIPGLSSLHLFWENWNLDISLITRYAVFHFIATLHFVGLTSILISYAWPRHGLHMTCIRNYRQCHVHSIPLAFEANSLSHPVNQNSQM